MRVRRNGSAQPTPQLGILLALIMGATILGMVRMAQQANAWGPSVGDIVSFAHVRPAFSPRVAFDVTRLGPAGAKTTCRVDSRVMRKTGGSLVVEAIQPTGAYVARWVGGATSAGARNCGESAELLLKATDVAALATSAGGFGVEH